MAAGRPQDGRRTGAGRPRIIKSVKQFEKLAGAYFESCEARGEPLLLMGLILAVGLSSRESLDEYGRRPEFSDSVKRAKARIEMEYERKLLANNPTGAIFALKNFGWTDRQQVDADVKANVKNMTLIDMIYGEAEEIVRKHRAGQQGNADIEEYDEDER